MKERETYSNKSNALLQAWHLCRSMSIKSWIERCLPNVVVKVPRNCWEITLNIAWSSTFRMTLSNKKIAITATEVVLVQLFSYTVVSKQNIKWEHEILWHFHMIQKSHLLSLAHRVSHDMSMFGLSHSFSNSSSVPILVIVQRLR